jgi:hypothetical protein
VEAPNEPDHGDVEHNDGSCLELFPFVLFAVVVVTTLLAIIFGGDA